ncbi:MAG: putative 4-hydroxybenzoyl-CoA thioesterase, partial [uncultured Nocardioidaceae bacterium]
VAHRDDAVGRRRRLRAHEQRHLLRAGRHRRQRPPAGGDRGGRTPAPRGRCRRGGVLPLLRRAGLPGTGRARAGGRARGPVLGRLPRRALPRARGPGERRGPLRPRLRRERGGREHVGSHGRPRPRRGAGGRHPLAATRGL